MAQVLKHSFNLFPNLPRNKFCDATFREKDSKRLIPVHRVVLAAVSKKFENIFEGKSCSDNTYEVTGVSFRALKGIIDYIYTGQALFESSDDYEDFCVGLVVLRIDLGEVENVTIKAESEVSVKEEYLELNTDEFELKWLKSEMEESAEEDCGDSSREKLMTSSSQDLSRKENFIEPEPVMGTTSDNLLDINQNNCKGTKRKCADGLSTEVRKCESKVKDTAEAVRTRKVTYEGLGLQIAEAQNVVINIPGGTPLTLPLASLQALQPGQGIPVGPPGQLLTRLPNGNLQILHVSPRGELVQGSQTTSGVALYNIPQLPPRSKCPKPSSFSQLCLLTLPVPVNFCSIFPWQQTTLEVLKVKCLIFLEGILKLILELTAEQPEYEVRKARVMVQFLINGYGTIEYSTSQIMKLFNSSPQDQPHLIPFLKLSLPPLQQSLATGELAITGTLPPVHLLKKDVKKPPPLSMPTI